MATAKETLASSNEAALELIAGIQQRIVDAQKELASTVAQLMADVPKPDNSDAADPTELVEESFAFQARLLEANKEFSLGLIEAWRQATPTAAAKKAAKPGTAAKR